jgi:hypothetical protein
MPHGPNSPLIVVHIRIAYNIMAILMALAVLLLGSGEYCRNQTAMEKKRRLLRISVVQENLKLHLMVK